MTSLIKYDAACRAISEVRAIDEIKDIRDKAEAMRQYARVSKNRQMEVDASEIRIRAERKLGQMLNEAKASGALREGRPKTIVSDDSFNLKDAGISLDLSARAQTIATIPDDDFEKTLIEHREEQKAVSVRTMRKLTDAGEKKKKRPPAVESLLSAWKSANAAERNEFLVEIGLATERPATNVWDSYADAYQSRYGVSPVRNAKVNSQLRQVVDRIGQDAPQVAVFYVWHDSRYYVQRMHAVDGLLHDAEKLRTEWATNTKVTATKAQQADRTQANGQVWGKLIAQAEANER